MMKHFNILLFFSLCFIGVAGLLLCSDTTYSSTKHKVVYYVSNKGNDKWSGLLPEPNQTGNDGPFATLEGARDSIRLKRAGSGSGFKVLVRGGVYRLNRTLILGPEDSGTESDPVIFQAYNHERAVLSGGKLIDNFQPYKGKIFKADLKTIVPKEFMVRQLFADGKRQILARFPNYDTSNPVGGGFLYVEDSVESYGKRKFKYHLGGVNKWVHDEHGEVFIFPRLNWSNDTVPINQIDRVDRVVTLSRDAAYAILPGNRYYFQNFLEELDSPGEWFFDNREKELYYWPEHETSDVSVSVPMLDTIVEIKAKKFLGKYILSPANISFEGFLLEDSNGDAIVVDKARNTTIARCTIRNVGGKGIVIKDGYDNKAIGNDVYDVGDTGIFLSGGNRKNLMPGRNRAENNYIHDVGVVKVSPNTSGLYCEGVGNVVAHNLIHSTPRVGIWFDGNDNVIEFNHVHHVNQRTQDSGIIYSCARDWTKRGNIIRFNYLHHSGGYGRSSDREQWRSPFETIGIYLDDWTSGTEVYGNIVAYTNWSAIHIHGGRDNIIENNVILEGGGVQMSYSSCPPSSKELPGMFAAINKMGYIKYPLLLTIEDAQQGTSMSGNKFLRNIVYYENPKSSLYKIYGTLDMARTVSDYNIIYHTGPAFLIRFMNEKSTMQWSKWKESGLDRSSVAADPLFSNLGAGSFELSKMSPALKLGFQQIPFDKIGLCKDYVRASWPIEDQTSMLPLSASPDRSSGR
jgi:parallel beta-helix repeat protein